MCRELRNIVALEKKTTISQQRKVQAYPSPKVYAQIEEYRVKNGMSRSEAVTDIVRKFLNTPPANSSPGKHHY